MERESFEDEATAAVMNERFVCVKVDREERPDVDALYMEAVQAMTGHGGWPLNVFVTPEQIPFYGGTYFPPEPRHGHAELAAGAARRRRRVAPARDEIREQGERMAAAAVGRRRCCGRREEPMDPRALDTAEVGAVAGSSTRSGAASAARRSSRRTRRSSSCSRAARRGCRSSTLHAMRTGGIFDQVGGGFARYAVDRTWTVPHFEKMLYDNALLARAYLHGWQVSERRRGCGAPPRRRSSGWRARCVAPEGGFYSALDADSEGVEGKYYVWTVAGAARGARPTTVEAAVAYFGATEAGQLRGRERARGARARAAGRAARARSAGGCTRCASSACGPASTTSA